MSCSANDAQMTAPLVYARLTKPPFRVIIVQGKKHIPSRELRSLVTLRKQRGCSNEQIAEYLNITLITLLKHYDVELRTAREEFTDKVFGRLASLIDGTNEMVSFNAQKFYLTHQAGWKSADKQIEVDAMKEQTAALERKRLIDERMAELSANKGADSGKDIS